MGEKGGFREIVCQHGNIIIRIKRIKCVISSESLVLKSLRFKPNRLRACLVNSFAAIIDNDVNNSESAKAVSTSCL